MDVLMCDTQKGGEIVSVNRRHIKIVVFTDLTVLFRFTFLTVLGTFLQD